MAHNPMEQHPDKHRKEMTEEESQDAIARARELSKEFDKVSATGDSENALQLSLVPLYKEAGMVDLIVPKKYGGQGADIWTVTQCSRELAKGDPSAALAFNMHQTMCGIWRGLLDEDKLEYWMPRISEEKLIISGPFSEERAGFIGLADTIATPIGNGQYKINGKKVWGTLSEACDIVSFNATIADPEGQHSEDVGEWAQQEMVWNVPMDTPGISIKRTWDAMGMRGTGTQTVQFEDVVVGEDAMVGSFRGGLYPQFEWAALTFSGVYLGAQEKAFFAARDILREKSLGATQEGSDVALKGLGFVQTAVGKMCVLCEQSALVLEKMCERLMKDNLAEYGTVEEFPKRFGTLEVAKLTVTENAIEVADLALRAIGGSAFRRGHVIERLYRDVRSGPFHPLTTDQIYDHLGKWELGLMQQEAAQQAEATTA